MYNATCLPLNTEKDFRILLFSVEEMLKGDQLTEKEAKAYLKPLEMVIRTQAFVSKDYPRIYSLVLF